MSNQKTNFLLNVPIVVKHFTIKSSQKFINAICFVIDKRVEQQIIIMAPRTGLEPANAVSNYGVLSAGLEVPTDTVVF